MPLAFRHPAAAGALLLALAVWLALEVRASRHRDTGDGVDRDRGTRSRVLLGYAVGVFGAAVVAAALPGATLPGPPELALGAGLVVIGAGLGLRWWAVRVLGSFFTYEVRVQPGQHVVTTGPYRLVRHPSYTGALVAATGVGLALGNGLSVLVAFLPPLVGTMARIRVEEAALREQLGIDYDEYTRHTARLFPGVW